MGTIWFLLHFMLFKQFPTFIVANIMFLLDAFSLDTLPEIHNNGFVFALFALILCNIFVAYLD